ncbi:hypothetical protein GCM10025781_17230 [Kocuria gwangalliensis]|uniref:Uncharacterized protein n=2 Tax=Kocuria TaxID=57493 RepID=A0ABP8X2L4_9MICC
MKETIPAVSAKGIATSNAPDWTFWAKNSPTFSRITGRAPHGRHGR